MKYAIIGCGRVAGNHLKAALNNKLEIVAVCDINSDCIDSLLTKYNLNICKYTDYKQMLLEHPEIELVAISTNSGNHAEIALYCIDCGKNIIIEKPISVSIKDADEIIRRSKAKNLTVAVSHQNRFNQAIQKLHNAVESGRFGKLSHAAVTVRWNRNKSYYEQADWRGTWANDGGCLMNQCIHAIDLLIWLLGDEVESVYGVTKRQFHDYIECEDLGMAILTFKNGVVATIEGTTNVYPKNLEESICIFGEKGTVKVGGTSANNIEIWNFADEGKSDEHNKGLEEPTKNIYGNGHTSLYTDVVDSIKNKRKPLIDAVSGRNAVEVVLAIYKSSFTGQPVKLPLNECVTTDFTGMF
ncbi:MAG: Gfo/Idh/MocA family oxidoreductase [Candidatus Riflebacteria bacterium]|nr:Gfo/Idh/MocA family oxidoreductase [Candidatus Riflebacteria bacterium]MBR4570944.1 Gfo/Idh/MocA family oxidoreductase [Candidatus Riflebacteria bacterium]